MSSNLDNFYDMISQLLSFSERPSFLRTGLLFLWDAPMLNNLQLILFFDRFNAHPILELTYQTLVKGLGMISKVDLQANL